MADVLDKILAQKRLDLARRKAQTPLDALRARCEPSDRSLEAALRKPGARFILELKKASPSKGVLRPDFDPEALARAFSSSAAALSVLTDGPFFQGDHAYLRAARSQFEGPILMKDFVLEPYQLYEGRAAGADAALLMLSVLDDATAGALLDVASSLGMDCLVEVHNEAELSRALALPAPILGINNRDLKTLKIDLAVTERLAPRVPSDRVLIAESGVHTRQDILRLSPRVDGFLIGSALMGADDPGAMARSLVFGRVKVCGLTSLEDLELAQAQGASFGGLIFAPGSSRAVELERAERMRSGASLPLVGVFQNQPMEDVASICERCGLYAAQLHGEEDESYRSALRARIPGVQIWQVVSIDVGRAPDEADIEAAISIASRGSDRLLLDTRSSGKAGGTGESFDWTLLQSSVALAHARSEALLAGGVRPQNAARAQSTGAWAIDLSSGVESSPGKKDKEKMMALFDALRPAGRETSEDTPGAQGSGRFGSFGGAYIPQLLTPALEALDEAFIEAQRDESFVTELKVLLAKYAGRPTPIYLCRNLVQRPGLQVFLKREDLLHGGAHKTNQVLGQALLAKRMGKTRLIAETGAGQHGVATAMVGALFGMETVVYMGAKDVARQHLNVVRMRMMGAQVVPVEHGQATLKEAIGEALRDWTRSYAHTHYLLGTVAGPHPFPTMVRDFQKVIGEEARAQVLKEIGRLPEAIFACVGGGSNAMGIFHAFLEDEEVQLIGVEPGGDGEAHGATISEGRPGILHGAKTMVLQDEEGQIMETHSIAAGLDYPGVGPEHAHLAKIGRARYIRASDQAALDAFFALSKTEGIIPALESAHAIAGALQLIEQEGLQTVLINLSGRGDKDVAQVAALMEARS